MRIALVIADLGSGGAQKVLTGLAAHWHTKGHDVSVVTLDDGADVFFTLADGITHVPLNLNAPSCGILSGFLANFRRILILRKALKALAPDTVVSFIAPTNVLTVLATRGMRAKIIISERNDPSRQSFGRLWDALRRLCYPWADYVVANSTHTKDAIGDFVSKNKTLYIPNQLSIPDERYCTAYDQKEKMILFTGRLHPQKGLDTLLHGFAEFYAMHSDWRLVIVGHGGLADNLRALAQTLGITDAVDFEGQVDDPYAYYARAKLFVLPSRYEGTPNALLEAMSCGVAAIVSDAVDGAKPYVDEAQMFAVDDATDLTRALVHMSQTPGEMERYGAAAVGTLQSLAPKAVFAQWDKLL